MKFRRTIQFLVLLSGLGIHAQNYEDEVLRVTSILHSGKTLDSITSKVIDNSGVLKALNEEMKMYEEEMLQKKRNWVSSFRFGVNLFSANTVAGPEDQSITTLGVLPNVGVTLSVDPEKLVNRNSYVRQAKHKLNRSKYLREDHNQRLKKEIINHYYEYLTLLESILLQENTLNTRKQHLYAVEVAFKNGNLEYSDVMVVENQYNLWLEQVTNTRIQVMRKKQEIQILLGINSYEQ